MDSSEEDWGSNPQMISQLMDAYRRERKCKKGSTQSKLAQISISLPNLQLMLLGNMVLLVGLIYHCKMVLSDFTTEQSFIDSVCLIWW